MEEYKEVKTLVIGFGNPGRSDDGLGPALAETVESWSKPSVATTVDYQLNIEHAADLAESDLVIFIDASVEAPPPFRFYRLVPELRNDFTTHAMVPETVLETCRTVYGKIPPTFVLAVRGENFNMGEGFSPEACEYMKEAELFLKKLLDNKDLKESCMAAVTN